MIYSYIVFYKNNVGGCGNAQIGRKRKIRGIEDVREIETDLRNKEKYEVSISDYKYIGCRLWK